MNNGIIFEKSLHKKLIECKLFNKIVHEKELIKTYGFLACSIDFMLEYENKLIFVQCKYKNTKRKETKDIKNYVKSMDYLSEKLGNKLYIGLWISKLTPFEDNIKFLSSKNTKVISHYSSVEDLSNYAINRINQELI